MGNQEKSGIKLFNWIYIICALFMLVFQCVMIVGMLYVIFELRTLTFELQEIIVGLKRANGEHVASDDDKLSAPLKLLKQYSKRSTNSKLLKKVVLPENPSEKQVVEYIDQILRTTINQRSFSSRDPQIPKLIQVGSKNLHLLLDAIDKYSHGMNDYHLMYAIKRLADSSHKKLILRQLPRSRDLIDVVVRKGWERDARNILIQGLEINNGYLPTKWIGATAKLNDKKATPLLIEHFIRGSNKKWTYDSIKHIPGIELKDAVAKAWENAKFNRNSSYELTSVAKIAVGYGHKDALNVLVNELTGNKNKRERQSVGMALKRHLDFVGSDKEIVDYYKKNKDNLVFDPKDKRFKIKK